MKPRLLYSRKTKKQDTLIKVKDIVVGKDITIIAGPCSVSDSKDEIIDIARSVKANGAHMLRGGAFKPRSSPYSFQGLGKKGLELLDQARQDTGLPIVTEVMDTRDVSLVSKYADIIQIGARNMQNFALLKEVGKQKKPVLLKRGLCATLDEFLMSAEYILSQGNPNVILCERGIRTFVDYTRNTLDLSIVPALKELTHLPIIIDPSHATGKRSYITPMSMASVAAGCHGLILEVHTDPDKSLSDKDQTIDIKQFSDLIKKVKKVYSACK